jgi:hypothetical protein
MFMLKHFAITASALLVATGIAVAQQSNNPGDDTPSKGACAKTPPHPACDEAKTMNLTDTKFEGEVVVGTVLPETVVVTPMTTNTVSVAYINGQRVLVDSNTRAIIEIVP